MTYPKLTLTYKKGVPRVKPPSGEMDTVKREATYYPDRWEMLPKYGVLRLDYEEGARQIMSKPEAAEGRDAVRLFIPVDGLAGWREVN